MANALSLAKQLLGILHTDADRLDRIDKYVRGIHDNPYMPQNADKEYRLLAQRAVSNWMPLLLNTPSQALYVDSFRPSRYTVEGQTKAATPKDSPEWQHWQDSRLDARQVAVHRGALAFGHSFTVTEKTPKGIRTKGLSAMNTAALFVDPANDNDPYAALTVTKWPLTDAKGEASMWDGQWIYSVTFTSLGDFDSVRITKAKKHGSDECPVTRFAAAVDLEGRTVGVVEPMIPLQNRINQTVFDLLVTQTYASFKVRWVTGMAPPVDQVPVYEDGYDGDPERIIEYKVKLDRDGNPVPKPINHNAKRFLFAEDPETNFGTLDETPLDGFINSIDMSIRHIAAVSQTPPHYLLGQIANISADALTAAETALSRKVEEFRKSFGESWERVFRLAAGMSGDTASAADLGGEVLWRDMEQRSLAQSADALGKLADQLQIPKRGLWSRVPDVTKGEMDYWEKLRQEDDTDGQLAEALSRAGGSIPDLVTSSDANTGNQG